MNRNIFPTILGITCLLAGIVAGVLLVQYRQEFRLGAASGTMPKNVRVSNTTDSSFTVSWTTDKKTIGFVKYGQTSSLGKATFGKNEELSYTHFVDVKNLSAQKEYFFKISSGGNDFENSGVAWQVTTGTGFPLAPETNFISGVILGTAGLPEKDALVYITAGGGSPLAAITSVNGVWLVNLGLIRTQNLTSYASLNNENTIVEISVQAGLLGVATAQIFPNASKPVPTITLGKTHDFRNLRQSKTDEIPTASVELPEEFTRDSRFEVEGAAI